MAEAWNEWNRYDWSDRLLRHHFSRAFGRTAPVDYIDVSEDALASCAGADPAETELVRDRFLQVIGRSGTKASPWAKLAGQKPTDWYAYLVAAGHVFVDSESADQGKCIAPMEEILGPTFVEGLHHMPALWEQLRDWLAARPGDYRQLILPDPGGWTRIGHAYKLAFPKKADQRAIGEALRQADAADDPTLDVALQAVRSVRVRLSEQMADAHDEFERLVGSGATDEELFEAALWSAILSSGRAVFDSGDRGIELGLTVYEDQDLTELVLVSMEPPDSNESWTEGGAPSPWRYSCDESATVSSYLGGDKSAGRLGRAARSGSIPLVDRGGYWEFPGRDELDQIVAHLRSTKAEAGQATGDEERRTGGGDWALTLGSGDVVGTPKPRRPKDRKLSLVGGVRLAKGVFLNSHLVRPNVVAPWAHRIMATVEDDTPFPLEPEGGVWPLKFERPVEGRVKLVAEAEGARVEKSLALSSANSAEPKPTSDPGRWSVDGAGQAVSLATERNSDEPQVIESANTVLLGRDVGFGADSEQEAAWAVIDLGDRQALRVVSDDAVPRARSMIKGDCRKWRKFLEAEPIDEATEVAAAAARAAARAQNELPARDGTPVGRFSERRGVEAHLGATRIETALAGITRSRSEVRISELIDFIETSTRNSLGRDLRWELLQDLNEAGVIEVATDLRWAKRSVLAVSPCLVAHSTASGWTAVLGGLTTEFQRSSIRESARVFGFDAVEIGAISRMVTSTLAITGRDLDAMHPFARHNQLRVGFLTSSPHRPRHLTDLQQGEPEKYDRWGTFEFPAMPGVEASLWRRDDAPQRYVARVGERAVQFRSRTTAEFWTAVGAGALELARDDTSLVSNVPIPLTVARWLAHLGGTRPGFDPKDRVRRYPAPNKRCAEIAERAIHEIIATDNPWSTP